MREFTKKEEKISKSDTAPNKITFLKNADAYRTLKSLVPTGSLANWNYTAFPEKVYVRGSKGFISWTKTAPRDLRPVIILELD